MVLLLLRFSKANVHYLNYFFAICILGFPNTEKWIQVEIMTTVEGITFLYLKSFSSGKIKVQVDYEKSPNWSFRELLLWGYS